MLFHPSQADSRLPCGWLDDYYGTSVFGVQRTGYGLPHESQISAYLFEDCTPMPPCGCSDIAFDGRDNGEWQSEHAHAWQVPACAAAEVV